MRAFVVLGLAGCVVPGAPGVTAVGPGEASPSNGQVTIPNVFGMTREQAVGSLHQAGFAGDITFDDNLCGSAIDGHVVELGAVCYQHPPAGAIQGARLPMTLRIQTENPWFGQLGTANEWRLMPPIVGMTLEDARAAMRKVGYTRDDRIALVWVDEPSCKPLTVCDTIPEAFARSGLNSDRVVYVGRDQRKAAVRREAAVGHEAAVGRASRQGCKGSGSAPLTQAGAQCGPVLLAPA